ncbi:hypothetical protein AVEN_143065-1 [Araneus ventricosus]|uniref:Uncharacterized protein n=1 Tax=Araneus ventricosus TaxID=182803 RepID=A0A4Y2WYZ9_ARAVE|nr:hypothetical protein AVEN_143065-1 [Araneus ventricosus]
MTLARISLSANLKTESPRPTLDDRVHYDSSFTEAGVLVAHHWPRPTPPEGSAYYDWWRDSEPHQGGESLLTYTAASHP